MKQAYNKNGEKIDYAMKPSDYVIDDKSTKTNTKNIDLNEWSKKIYRLAIENGKHPDSKIKSCLQIDSEIRLFHKRIK